MNSRLQCVVVKVFQAGEPEAWDYAESQDVHYYSQVYTQDDIIHQLLMHGVIDTNGPNAGNGGADISLVTHGNGETVIVSQERYNEFLEGL